MGPVQLGNLRSNGDRSSKPSTPSRLAASGNSIVRSTNKSGRSSPVAVAESFDRPLVLFFWHSPGFQRTMADVERDLKKGMRGNIDVRTYVDWESMDAKPTITKVLVPM